ncbi:DUF6255 family natural product biosynthesis protein [Streptomyces syringium]|uniref:DUF6255 family natural product biosynthesis protein n=1 Tax=Streptomyces syringium TaxID=76729 RepID=UPI0036D0B0FD
MQVPSGRPVWEVAGVPPGTTRPRPAAVAPSPPRIPCRHTSGWSSTDGVDTCKACGTQRAMNYSGVWPSKAHPGGGWAH